MSLTEARFHDLVDDVQLNVENTFDGEYMDDEAFQDLGLDVDIENSSGVLTIEFSNGSKLIFSRQEPLRQLWLATLSGAFHFDYDEEKKYWICGKTDELLKEVLVRVTKDQAGVDLEFDEI